MSSSRAVVPDGRAPATAAYRPLRTCQARRVRFASEVNRAGAASGSPASSLRGRRRTYGQGLGRVLLVLDQQRGVAFDRQLPQRLVGLRVLPGRRGARPRRAARRSPVRRRPGPASEPVAARRSGKTSSPVAACGRTGTVRKVASATKASVPSLPTTRWARMSTGRVWSRNELTPYPIVFLSANCCVDDADRAGIVPHPVPQRPESLVQRRLGVRSRSSASEAPVSMTLPARQHQDQRLQRAVGVELRTAGHAAGVVGDHAADGAGRLARRVRAEPAPVRGQPGVHLAHRRAGLHPDPGAVVQDLHLAEVPPGVDQYAAETAWPLRLVPPDRNVSGTPAGPRPGAAPRARSAPAGATTACGTSR